MRYEAMAQDALRGVVKTALKRAAAPEGLPGAHHFYITFKTEAAGVSGPVDILGKYPDEMTIVLQHQYWDLAAPGPRPSSSVTLQFGGQPKRLSVPYAAVTRFYDPSVQFLLQGSKPPPATEGQAQRARGRGRAAAADPRPRPRTARPRSSLSTNSGRSEPGHDRRRPPPRRSP